MLQTSVLLICLCLGVGHSLGIKDCPDSNEPDLYYKGMCYKLVLNRVRTFWNARKDCMSTGGSLAVIESEDVNMQIKKLIQWYFHFNKKSDVWIGLSDADMEGRFLWSDGTALAYSNWGDKQGPGYKTYHQSFHYGTSVIDEDCVAISSNGKWNDHQCTAHWFSPPQRLPYVCQFKPVSHPIITVAPTTPEPTTPEPTTPEQTTPEPTTQEPTTPEPSMTETTTTEQEPTSAYRTTPFLICPPFYCMLDCGMDGYLLDDRRCYICECNV